MSQEDRSYERISPTAWLVTYQRTFSDIPFSQEIFLELQEIIKQTRSTVEIEDVEKSMNFSGITQHRPEPGSHMGFIWEARYKIVNHLLKAYRINQILEVASGVSPRGLEMARDPSVEYVEVDLTDAIRVKKDIIKRLVAKSIVSKQPNLHLEEGNALNLQDLLRATRFFSVERHRSSEVIDELVSPQKGNQRLEEVEKITRPMAVFVMEINPSKS